MTYVIDVYEGKKKVGLHRFDDGAVIFFNDKKDAQTYANIEGTQMEGVRFKYKPREVVPVYPRKKKYSKKLTAKRFRKKYKLVGSGYVLRDSV